MKFQVQAGAAGAALKQVMSVIERRTTLPVLAHVLVKAGADGITFEGTNLEQWARRKCEGDVLTPGAALIRADVLSGLLARAPEDSVTVEVDDKGGTVRAGKRGRWQLPIHHGSSLDEFPSMGAVEGGSLTLPAATLARGMSMARPAASPGDVRIHLRGVALFVNGREARDLSVVSTDGHRMHAISFPDSVDGQDLPIREANIPMVAAAAMESIAAGMGAEPVELRIAPGSVALVTPTTTLYSRMIEGRFPDYQRVVPDRSANWVELDAAEFISALQRSMLLQREREDKSMVILRAQGDELTIVNEFAGASSDESIEIHAQGGEWKDWGGAPKYLVAAVNALATVSDRVRLYMKSHDMAMRLDVAGGDETACVIMPMRI